MIKTSSGLLIKTDRPDLVYQKGKGIVISDPKAVLDFSELGPDGFILKVGKKRFRIKII